jgi:hypothetical protein
MRKITLCVVVLTAISISGYGQICGFEHHEEAIRRSSELRKVKDSVQTSMVQWLKNNENSRLLGQEIQNPYAHVDQSKVAGRSLCGNDNTYVGWGNAPTVVGSSITGNDMEGGDYITVFGMQANRSYRISTCGQNDFDTQLTIYPSGGGNAVAHNDDACANNQSEIIFCPTSSGNYDILLDEWDCDWTITVNTNVTVELIYENRPVYTLPVVFHIVHNTAEENVSDAAVYDQLAILNEHFLRLNSGLFDVPAAFRGQSSSPLIQFCLAQQDPNGLPTSGIERFYTDSTEFPSGCGPNIPCLYLSDMGGADEWDKEKYINIWVADLSAPSAGVGFSKHPYIGMEYGSGYSGLGIAIDYQAFSAIGSNSFVDRQLGHTAIHEMGHFFGLWHLWGNDNNLLCATDSVLDTPSQEEPTFGIVSNFPLVDDCSTIYPGVMYPNYMDYTNDFQTDMFTYKQTAVIDYALFEWYSTLMTSNGCQPGLATGLPDVAPPKSESGLVTQGQIPLTNVPFDEVRMFDMTGRVVSNWSAGTQVDISNVPAGFYVMHWLAKGEIVSLRRVVKQ